MSLKVENIIAGSAAVFLGLIWFALSYLESNPRKPNSEEGRTMPAAVKGVIVHITENQQNLLSWLNSGFVWANDFVPLFSPQFFQKRLHQFIE